MAHSPLLVVGLLTTRTYEYMSSRPTVVLGNRDQVKVRDGSNIDYVIDANTNRYTSVGGNSLTYDAAGNLITDKDGYEYEYDYENRIVKITKDNNDIAEFTYDALGRRIEKKDVVDSNNTRRYYYNNNWQAYKLIIDWFGGDSSLRLERPKGDWVRAFAGMTFFCLACLGYLAIIPPL